MLEKEVRHLFEGNCVANGVTVDTSHGMYYGDLYKIGGKFILECNPHTRMEHKTNNLAYTKKIIGERAEIFDGFDPETVVVIIGAKEIWGMQL